MSELFTMMGLVVFCGAIIAGAICFIEKMIAGAVKAARKERDETAGS